MAKDTAGTDQPDNDLARQTAKAKRKPKTPEQEQAKAERMKQYHTDQASLETEIRQDINDKAEQAIQSYKAIGRPRVMSDAIKEEIIDRMANGQSLTAICQLDHMPAPATVINETDRDKAFLAAYSRARMMTADVLFNQCLDIADDDTRDVIASNDGSVTVNNAAIARDKLKIETRFRMAGKLNIRYQDKALLSGDGASVTVNQLTVNARDMSPDARDRLRAILQESKDSIKTIEG